MRAARLRLVAAGAAALTVVAGLGIRAGVGGELAKIAGDALYTVLVYAVLVVIVPRTRPATVAAVALGFSWLVEFFQLSGIPADLSERSVVARLVLGSTFHPLDLLWYAVGAGFAWLVHVTVRRAAARGSGNGNGPPR